MKKRSGTLRGALTKPVDTFSGWAITALLIVIVMGLMGWFLDDFGTVAVIGAACILGAAVGAVSRARKQRAGGSKPS